MSAPEFGQEIRDQEFSHLVPQVAFLNHGSYGVVPKQVKDAQLAMLAEFDSDPDMFMRRLSSGYWESACQAMASYLSTSPDQIAMVVNTTTAINAVLKSLTFQSGDAILQSDWTYGAVKNTIAYVAEKTPGLQIIEMDYPYPISSKNQVIQAYETILDANPNIKLAVIDHISSVPSVLIPIAELITACKSRGVLVLIDGAHCVGQMTLNLDTLGADFYASSLHKWFYCARGCGILYVDQQYRDIIKPSITSFDYDLSFPSCFRAQGTRDPVPLFQCTAGINFQQYVGGQSAISAYVVDLLDRMTSMLTTAWGTGMFEIPQDMVAPYLRVVRLPTMSAYPVSDEGAAQLFNDVRDVYNIWLSIQNMYGSLFIRLSGQIYCTETDYERLRDAILALQAGPPKQRKTHKPYFDDDIKIFKAPYVGKYKTKMSKTCIVQRE